MHQLFQKLLIIVRLLNIESIMHIQLKAIFQQSKLLKPNHLLVSNLKALKESIYIFRLKLIPNFMPHPQQHHNN